MKIDYCCNQSHITAHYQNQAGSGFSPSPYFRGGRQAGSGIGSIFRSIGRVVLPLVSKGAKAIGRQALSTGIQIAKDVVGGKSLKESAIRRGKQAGKSLIKQATSRKRKAPVSTTTNIKRRKTRKATSRTVARQKDIFDGGITP